MEQKPQPYGYVAKRKTKKSPRDYLDSINVNNEAKIQGKHISVLWAGT